MKGKTSFVFYLLLIEIATEVFPLLPIYCLSSFAYFSDDPPF